MGAYLENQNRLHLRIEHLGSLTLTAVPSDFYRQSPLQVQFSDLELSSDAGLVLVRQASV